MTKTLYAWALGSLLLLLPSFVQSQCDVVPSFVTTTGGLGYVEIDSTDSQIIDVMTNSTANANYTYAITGNDFNIIRFLNGSSADISDLDAGKYFIWGFSYTGTINLVPGDLVFTGSFSTGCFQISHTAVVIQKLFDGPGNTNPCAGIDGGTVELALGGTDTTIIIDGNPDMVSFSSIGASNNTDFTYIVTDSGNNIVGIPSGNSVDFDQAGVGTCYVYGLSYTGNLQAMMGDNINGLQFSDDCFDLSDNFLTINRIDTTNVTTETQFFVSSNTQSVVGIYNVLSNGMIDIDSFNSVASDADGIYYDMDDDVLYQLNRSSNVLNAYNAVNASLSNSMTPLVSATSSSDFTNGREVTVSGDRLVVAQDADSTNNNQNRFYIYDISPTGITLVKAYDADINLWGIHADGSTLYAVEDNSNRLAIYRNFFVQPAGSISPSSVVEVEDLVRTHGLTYDATLDAMILTDVGDAASSTDGAIVVISDFTNASDDGFISSSEQVRIEGPMSMLGNPVDVAWDRDRSMIYVAERANGGGRILGFSLPAMSGDIAPDYNDLFPGASAIYIKGDEGMSFAEAQLFVSSNTQSEVGVVSVLQNGLMQFDTFNSAANDADGIYYDRADDLLYQFNRTDSVVNIYADVALSLDANVDPFLLGSSTPDVINGREIAISGDRLVVAQDADSTNGNMNRFYLYDISAGNIVLDKVFDADINLWGIHADAETLYAVVDNSNNLAVYDDFFNQPAGAISPTMTVEVEGIVRTHGLTYDSSQDVMILTDIGSAGDDDDGAFVVIANFMMALADSIITVDEQVRVSGDQTLLGNPVDVAWDAQRNIVFVAERANGGGRILGFRAPESDGNYAPIYDQLFAGASAVYLNDTDGIFFQDEDDVNRFFAGPGGFDQKDKPQLTLFPNPVANYMTLQWEQPVAEAGETALVRVIDNNGRVMMQREVAVWEGTMQMGMVVSDLKGGIYQVLVEGQSDFFKQRFFKP